MTGEGHHGGGGFVGRSRERSLLADRVAAAAGGAGGLVVVAGEAGIGKTRLCEELTRTARAAGVGVAWAGCWESARTPASRSDAAVRPTGPDVPAPG